MVIFMEMRVRPARKDDIMLLFKWANDPVTRRASFNQDLIPLDKHKEWFRKILSEKVALLLIVELLENDVYTPIAQVRIDSHDCEISFSIASEHRGKHLAADALSSAINYIKNKKIIDRMVAHIKSANEKSIKAFERAGFCFVGEIIFKGHACLEYVYEMHGGT
jgi:RimJ/RimL family protein N-acetyltransferase